MNEQEILDYQRERMEAAGTSPAELDRIFGTGTWSYEVRLASEEAGDPYPFVPKGDIGSPTLVGFRDEGPYVPPTPYIPPAPVILPVKLTNGGGTMPLTNGYGTITPGAPPPLQLMANGGGMPAEAGTDLISIQGLALLLRSGVTIALGFIRALIAKVGWGSIAAILGTALAAKVLAMLNDGSSDDTDIIGVGAAGMGVTIVKRWRANNLDFWMDSAGYMYVRTKSGVIKRWRPKKPIVMVRGKTTLAQAVKAQRYLDHMWRTVAKRTKALKLA